MCAMYLMYLMYAFHLICLVPHVPDVKGVGWTKSEWAKFDVEIKGKRVAKSGQGAVLYSWIVYIRLFFMELLQHVC